MADYKIMVDSSCDIDTKTLLEWDMAYVELSFMFEGFEKEYKCYDLTPKVFYDKIRSGASITTSAVNSDVYEQAFREILESGKDVLYIAFSSGLSSTYNNSHIAANDLLEEYPDRKIIIIDSLSASAGYGLIAYMTKLKKDEGASIEEAAEFAEGFKLKVNHWFSVDDMKYLKKGGRIGSAAAKVATKIGIKPVLHMDDEGHLVYRYIVRGKKSLYKAFLEEYAQRARTGGTVFACHSDCIDEVKKLEEMFKEHFGVTFKYIADVGPVIGGHTGPGTFSIFFEGAGR